MAEKDKTSAEAWRDLPARMNELAEQARLHGPRRALAPALQLAEAAEGRSPGAEASYRQRLAQLFAAAGERAKALTAIERALELARVLGDDHAVKSFESMRGLILKMPVGPEGSAPLWMDVNARLGELQAIGRRDGPAAVLPRAHELAAQAAEAKARGQEASYRNFLAQSLEALGKLDEALAEIDEALKLARVLESRQAIEAFDDVRSRIVAGQESRSPR